MASKKKIEAPTKSEFVSTFRKYGEMTEGEQSAFRQGCKTVSNKVKDNLGLSYKKVV